jgi:hypothetical protein
VEEATTDRELTITGMISQQLKTRIAVRIEISPFQQGAVLFKKMGDVTCHVFPDGSRGIALLFL